MSNNLNEQFSCSERTSLLRKAESEVFDIIIIGGGITGVGIALDAVSRGLKTLLVEKNDFASGTSSKSTKLIHGGLRYLKQLEIGLVRETGTERAIVHKLAPHLVHPEKMLLPIVKGGTFGKLSASLAISVYDFLAEVASEDRKKTLSLEEAVQQEPLIKSEKLKAAIEYSEYRTDDARLTIEIAKKANALGAIMLNHCEMTELIYDNGKVNGFKAYDEVTQKEIAIKSKYVVSAAGPWVDDIRGQDHEITGKHLRLTKGVHLVFEHSKLPVNQAIYFDDFQGRMLFAIPRGKVTYVGTSDTDFNENKDEIYCKYSDVKYILSAVNKYFDDIQLKPEDVISTWAGVRPLIQEEGKSASEVSRKDEIFESDSCLISIAGGKLTGYRKMAERIVDMVIDKLDLSKSSVTKELHLSIKDGFQDYKEVKAFIESLTSQFSKLDELTAQYLVHNYGRESQLILDSASEIAGTGQDFDISLLEAEIAHSIKYESVYYPDDFFNRRSGMLYFDPLRLRANYDRIIESVSQKFGWNDSDKVKINDEMKKFRDIALVPQPD